MEERRQAELRQIQKLLHDATLQEVTWDRALATFTARFNCLRRNTDGSEMADPAVEFTLSGVAAVAVGYDSSSLETPPRSFSRLG